MPDETDESRRTASPYATGGGGTRLEHRLGTVLLVRLLTAEPVLELGERAPERVAFQQAPTTSVDDLVATASATAGTSFRLEIAVRRSPKFIRSHEETKALVVALVRADLDAERDSEPLVERRLAVAVSGQQTHAQEIAELAVVARGQSTAEKFIDLIRTPGKFATHSRLDHLIDMVAAALVEISDEDAGSPEHRCWSLLRRLWIMQVDLETGHEDDWTRLVGDLKQVAIESSDDAAAALRDRLEQLSAELARNAGVVDAPLLRRRLHGHIRPDAHVPPAGWTRLLALDEQARVAVARSLTWAGSTSLTLPRRAIRGELIAAMTADGDLIVTGDSGVGKSALVMDAIEPGELGVNRQAIALNLRHLPTSQLELLGLLSTPFEELFSELTAPDRLLVIDSAEAAGEDHREVFSYLLRSARGVSLKVIAIAATEGAGTVTQLMASRPREFAVPGLDDDEIATAASHMSVLQRLVDNPRARELLRRPIVIELFAQANDPGLPLSEAQALDHIWHHLVRNDERRNMGAPDAREQVMLQLAAHAVRRCDVDELLARLDHAAVDGLRRGGLLLPASRLPWERVPTFKHDLLRAYSVARWLLAERDPAAALTTIGAPRWTLPSARLACEIVLSAPDEPTHPRAGRYARLQTGFDAIADAGGGERWSDVPAEALLEVPDGAELLKDAWPTLLDNGDHGLARLIRVLHSRHQRTGILDPIIAEPVVSQLLNVGTPGMLAKEANELIRDWLRAHVFQGTPAGQPTRVALRDAILDQCAENERVLDEQEADRQAQLAARTLEEVAADEEQERKFASITVPMTQRRHRRPEPTRHRPYQWIRDAQVEHLALLGPDLGSKGESILRRIAEDEPHSLDHAVEPIFAGFGLSAYDPKLLIDLAAAYYIEDEDDDDGFGWSGEILNDGIRHHRFGGLGTPLASLTNGPFLALFRADYRGGVALLNRMLDHAAHHRVRILSNHRYGYPIEEDHPGMKHILSITGEPREYVGDSHVWLWYRGTGVGPYPCMSALQALEFVTEEYIRAGVPPHVLTMNMIKGAYSLAMPALALGVLVRHLEVAGAAIDPYLVEPTVWQLEFLRVIDDQVGGLAARIPGIPNPDRRGWSLREVSMMLTFRAEGDRIAHLKVLGEQLLANAVAEVGDDSSAGARKHLAAVQNWASSLDRAAYEMKQEDDHILIQQAIDPEVEQVLEDTNADLRRTNDAMGLTVRHAHVRNNGGRAPDIHAKALAADVALARQLLDDPPQSMSFSVDGPVAAAASAVELHLSGRVAVADDNLAWSATALLQVAAGIAETSVDRFDDSFFSQGADRSAARALPFLLLPAARDLRAALGVQGADDVNELIELNRAVSVRGVSEVRLAYARTLDAVWSAPCDTTHLHGRCHHSIAFDLVTESFVDSKIGPWNPEAQRRSVVRLDPPEASTLDTLNGDNIYARRLTPALRAMGAAAISSACCRENAQAALRSLLSAHQRAMLTYEHGYQHSQSDALVAARAALWQAIDGRDDVVLEYVRNNVTNARLLAEALRALAAAAEERAEAGQHARRLWPNVMDLVLDAAETNAKLFKERSWGDYAEAALIPNPAAEWGYLTIELAGQPYRWRDPLTWRTQVDRWLGAITRSRMSIDNLVIAVRDLDVADQIKQGLRWIERIVTDSGANCVSTYTLPEWLHERRADLITDDQIARWQRVVDLLVVAGDSRVADLAD
ncbi:MAG: hypothetical protein M9936_27605 [Caldilinea sp.]|nr:hypothetical protein [Caldilinea sp.]MCB0151273.1 hypothetical protein [Caldilineaceae bacterium]MCB9117615.1 hypothetical protein [Caldilineaceae bacterium]MCO5213485.1 hypothetical protein [Caldilinea sp.]MCW5840853.1 hypothetical protein [Caldilinea sp.]